MRVTLIVIGALTWSALPLAAQHGTAPHWGYEGTHGPEYWGTLDTAYKACVAGKQQSPIDIRHVKPAPLPAITFSYQPSPLNVIDNGHTVQVTYAPGSFITVGDQRYELLQFHFHHPAEEKVFGNSYPMVVHLVHKNAQGKLAVVAVLLKEGEENGLITRLWSNLPAEHGEEVAPQGVSVDANELLPAMRGYFTFAGSLTTPPCTEGVTWFVLKEPATVSRDQIATFAHKYPHNSRPVQLVNGRLIQETP
ncbi:MAG TPA: carbonic anhydrase family protein [Gemmatimonadales bacterium]|nr:carbonic anhydrase family protein [Gemmatimonadales bacterium]